MLAPRSPALLLLLLIIIITTVSANDQHRRRDGGASALEAAEGLEEEAVDPARLLLLPPEGVGGGGGGGGGAEAGVPLPVFLEEPSDAFVVKNKPATLTCRAAHALQVYFRCNGARFGVGGGGGGGGAGAGAGAGAAQQDFVDPQTGVRNVEASINVSRIHVEEYFARDKFTCECVAWSSRGEVRSRPAAVDIAYLKKAFEWAPRALAVEAGARAEMRCEPPQGRPAPRVWWLRDGSVAAGHGRLLLLPLARLHDAANYSCVAENAAARRVSDPAPLAVYVNGGWSAWGPWGECSARCGRGSQRRQRQCSNPAPANGGAGCAGSPTQRQDCGGGAPCPPVDGRWSAWGAWTACGADCRQTRRRACASPAPSGGGRHCAGRDVATADCSAGLCPPGPRGPSAGGGGGGGARLAEQAKRADLDTDVALYIGLAVAFAVFAMVAALLVRVLRRKGRDHSMYNMAASDYQPEYFPEQDKKGLGGLAGLGGGAQPDLTQTAVLGGYEYPFADAQAQAPALWRSCSEHHYDVPHLGGEGSSCSSSSSSSSSSSCPLAATPPPTPLAAAAAAAAAAAEGPSAWASASVAGAGGRLSLGEAAGVALTVPPGAVPRAHRLRLHLAVLRDDCHRPKLQDGQTQLSPVVMTGPSSATFKKPVILNFHHCANLEHGPWRVTVLSSDNQGEEPSVWKKVVTLGEETINTPVFTQLDHRQVFLVSEQLARYVLVGESSQPAGQPGSQPAAKALCLAVFGPSPLLHPQPVEYSIRVYTLEDTLAALEGVVETEAQLGGFLLDKPKTMMFQDGGASMCLSLEDIGPGWQSKPQAEYQEIPFQHIWSSTHNHLHCSFTLERTDRQIHSVAFRILASQKGSQTHRQMFQIHTDLQVASPGSTLVPSTRSLTTVTTSSGCSSLLTSLDPSPSPFRFHRTLRKQLCQYLDPPNSRGNDWRMLAQHLNVDRYINYFATKASPTDHILDLWEARHRDPTSITDFLNILRVMGRSDAATVIEKELGPWL